MVQRSYFGWFSLAALASAVCAVAHSIAVFAISVASYFGSALEPWLQPPYSGVDAETQRQTTARAQVANFSDHRRARFDRRHADQGWLLAA